jgi:hypothetical protein
LQAWIGALREAVPAGRKARSCREKRLSGWSVSCQNAASKQ